MKLQSLRNVLYGVAKFCFPNYVLIVVDNVNNL